MEDHTSRERIQRKSEPSGRWRRRFEQSVGESKVDQRKPNKNCIPIGMERRTARMSTSREAGETILRRRIRELVDENKALRRKSPRAQTQGDDPQRQGAPQHSKDVWRGHGFPRKPDKDGRLHPDGGSGEWECWRRTGSGTRCYADSRRKRWRLRPILRQGVGYKSRWPPSQSS